MCDGTGCLVNITDGGEGNNYWKGKKLHEDAKQKMSIARKKYLNTHVHPHILNGFKHSKETISLITEKIGYLFCNSIGMVAL